MSNDYFTANNVPAFQANLQSSTVRNEYAAVEDGFDKLPTLSGNGDKRVAVNPGGTALIPTYKETFSTGVPTGGVDGDVWFQLEA